MSPLLAKRLRYYGLFRPLAALPLPLAYRLAGRIGRIDGRRQEGARAAIDRGLAAAFPQAPPAERAHWVERHFVMRAREILDVFTMPARTPANSTRLLRLQPGSLEVLQEARCEGRGVIIAMAHYDRLNLLLLALALAGERLGMLTMVVDERNPELDPVERRYLEGKIRTLLGFIGGTWITVGDDLRRLYRALAAGEILVVLFDVFEPGSRRRTLELPFLNGTLTVSGGIARLAERTGARVIYGVARESGWGVEAELRSLPADPVGGLAGAVQELERDVRAAPWSWWHWNILELIWRPHKDSTSNA